jgi:HK97 family phage major capsid protein
MAGIKEMLQQKADLKREGLALLKTTKTEATAARFAEIDAALDALEIDIARAQRYADEERGAPAVETPAARPAFASFGEQLGAVASAALSGSVDRRLTYVSAGPAGASEGVASDGGYLVQSDFSSELIRNVFSVGEILPRLKKLPITGNSLTINAVAETSRVNGSRWGGIVAYWKGEAGAATASKPKFREMKLGLKKLIGLCYATDEELEDAPALETIIKDGFTEEFSFLAESAVINGSGAGEPLGFLKSGAVVSVPKVAAQAAKTIVSGNVLDMWARLPSRSRSKALWLINQDAEPQLPQMTIGGQPAGVYLQPGAAGNSAPFGRMFGAPVVPAEQCETLGTAGDLILFDPSQYVWIDKAIQAASSIHVKFDTDEMAFRFVWRCDGQPMWNSAVTPHKGSNTISPFVTVAAR